MLKKKWLEIKVIKKGQLLIEEAEKEIIEKIKKLETKDNEVVKAVEVLQSQVWLRLQLRQRLKQEWRMS